MLSIPSPKKTAAAIASIEMFTTPAIVIATITSITLEPLDPPQLGLGAAADAVLRQRRVQIDDVRHDGRAEDPGGEEQRLAALEARDDEVAGDLGGIGLRERDLEREGDDDDADERRDHRLEPAVAVALEREDRERAAAGEQPRREERDAEKEVEAERGAEDLGEVGRHGDQLGLDPERHRDGPPEVVAAHLREVAARRDPELRRERLHDHRHQVRGEDDPEQEVAELRAGRNVRGEVPGIDVGDRGDERRPEERPESAQALPLTRERLLGGTQRRRLARQHVPDIGRRSRGRRPGTRPLRIHTYRNYNLDVSKSRGLSRRQLIVGAAPVVAAAPFAGLALAGRKELDATHMGADHPDMGHAAMYGESVPAPGGPNDLDALTYPPSALPHEPGRVREYTLLAQDREIEVAKGVVYPAWTYNGTARAR